MKKVLFVASVASMIDQFNMDNIHLLQSKGCDVHVAANFSFGSTTSKSRVDAFIKELELLNVKIINILFPRRVGSVGLNYKVYKELKSIVNNYDIIHVHSPIGGFITRLALIGNKKNKHLKLIYTAHGFHFFKGSSIVSWMLFYPIEFVLSFFTDVLITINREDYNRSQKLFACETVYIPGVGVDLSKYEKTTVNVFEKRKQLGVPSDSFIVLSVGELCDRKNHKVIIQAISKLSNKDIYYLICGEGNDHEKLKALARKNNVEDNVFFLGFRLDVNEIIKSADCFALPSKREGLGIAAIEAMAAGLPIITSNINGISDYSISGKTGYSFAPNNVGRFAWAINKLYKNRELKEHYGVFNKEIVKKFDICNVHKIMDALYSRILHAI
jgi:glycosyltransferase involved in cell wall biosynthesis